ncbi:hypothetical protein [Streptomyces sp. S.PB5]|uniref:hypothetical protein n=1 Tax=Streptomyces sp. S.PB5 TaxID=3020844 RepID=UPI0025B1695E|nr:hypothetical protein [Streptomyces sp. S.PB5]MDN3021519.1 hypothetical protein [Streptomyces sp. S.PB5]
MSAQHQSVIYILGMPDHVPPETLVHAEEHPDALAAIYLNPLEIRSQAVWDLNWLVRHHVGHALWRQNWTLGAHEGRMQEPPEGHRFAASRWEIDSARKFPRGVHVVPIEVDGNCVWYIRAGSCTQVLVTEMNVVLERIAGDALWIQRWYAYQDRFPHGAGTPAVSPPGATLLV